MTYRLMRLMRKWRPYLDPALTCAGAAGLIAYIWVNAGHDRWGIALIVFLLANCRSWFQAEKERARLRKANADVCRINAENVALNTQLRTNIVELASANRELERRLQADVEYLAQYRAKDAAASE